MTDKAQAYAPGVYGLVGGAVNVYVVDDAESGLTIIDVGLPGSVKDILALVHDIGRMPQDVRHILITHADIDHVGSLKGLVAATGARVYASADSAMYIQRRQSPPHIPFPMTIPARIVGLLALRAVPVDQLVADGDVLDIAGGMRVLATPGHTPDHVSFFWERERVLFAGDLFRNMADGLSLTLPRITHDVNTAQQSARSALALDPAVICPGHGQVWSAAEAPEQARALLAALPGG
ncbi:MAG: MBL fold metallo-hydrolase [Chloroflexi bacterium]|nr:MBL fold metallo-hydrolase [Chloroflexota bacterium]